MRLQCKIGHRFSLEGLSEAHSESLERGLWLAIRQLEDRAVIHQILAKKREEEKEPKKAERLRETAEHSLKEAKLLREIAERVL